MTTDYSHSCDCCDPTSGVLLHLYDNYERNIFCVPVFEWMYSILRRSTDEFDANTSGTKSDTIWSQNTKCNKI